MLSHYLLNFVITTVAMVALLYMAYLYIRNNPSLSGVGNVAARKPQQSLSVESVLTLEPRKRVYVLREGNERFLIATTGDKTEILATLEKAPETEAEAIDETPSEKIKAHATRPQAYGGTVAERFRYSLKLVILDRFAGLGGK